MFEKEAEEFEREYYSRRPTEPYSEDDNPNDWANIVQYAEENLDKSFKTIVELEKENAELKEKVSYLEDNLRVARKDRENFQLKVGKGLKEFIKDCPYSSLKLYANGYYVEQLTKAKEIIKEMLSILPKENIEGVYEITEEAEQLFNEARAMEGAK